MTAAAPIGRPSLPPHRRPATPTPVPTHTATAVPSQTPSVTATRVPTATPTLAATATADAARYRDADAGPERHADRQPHRDRRCGMPRRGRGRRLRPDAAALRLRPRHVRLGRQLRPRGAPARQQRLLPGSHRHDRVQLARRHAGHQRPARRGHRRGARGDRLHPGGSRRPLAGHAPLRRSTSQRSRRTPPRSPTTSTSRAHPTSATCETLSLSSQRDIGDTPHHATGSHVTTVTLTDEDHFAVAASTRSFVELYRYLRGADPQYTEVQCGEPMVTVEGIAESFADNVPQPGRIEIREVGDTPRAAGPPLFSLTPTGDGHFGPIAAEARRRSTSSRASTRRGTLIGYQYFTPFKRSNRLVRVLSPSANPTIASLSTDLVVRGAGHAALIARWDGGGFRQDLGAQPDDRRHRGADQRERRRRRAGDARPRRRRGRLLHVRRRSQRADQPRARRQRAVPVVHRRLHGRDARRASSRSASRAGSEDQSIVDRRLRIPNWPSDGALILMMLQ